ncbi:MAG TPA: hypothetical protein VFF21_02340 [Flavobacteriaceae bacterium]|nr:hypothetical protein [Flavobacteriaceae bacterium]
MSSNVINLIGFSDNKERHKKVPVIIEELPFPVNFKSFYTLDSLLYFLESFREKAFIIIGIMPYDQCLNLLQTIRDKFYWEGFILTVVRDESNKKRNDELFIKGANIIIEAKEGKFEEQTTECLEVFWKILQSGEHPKDIIMCLR